MRKFFAIVFISVIFFACLYAGIYLAETTAPVAQPKSNQVNFESANQLNVLLIVTDQVDQSPTNFISAWTIIFYYHKPSGIIILPLSLRDNENYNRVTELFHLDNKRFITKQSLNSFQQEFDMKWDGTIMVDLVAIQSIFPWISSQTVNPTIEEFLMKTTSSGSVSEIIDPVCNSLSQYVNPVENLNWESIYNTHLLSNLPEEKLKSIWTNFSEQENIECDWAVPDQSN